jgi:hypothetical protein
MHMHTYQEAGIINVAACPYMVHQRRCVPIYGSSYMHMHTYQEAGIINVAACPYMVHYSLRVFLQPFLRRRAL